MIHHITDLKDVFAIDVAIEVQGIITNLPVH
jgi:hypothetical protein